MEGPYVYQPLKKADNIRVFVLEPATNLTDTLIGELREVDLEDVPYTALSYSWAMEDDRGFESEGIADLWKHGRGAGTPLTTKQLFLDNAGVLIGENLRDALRRLRQLSTKPSTLWIDAVCINQRDNAEKSSQVSMMDRVYTEAAKVVAWLGEGDESENALAMIAIQCLCAGHEQRARCDVAISYLSDNQLAEICSTEPVPPLPQPTCPYCCDQDGSNTQLHNTITRALYKLSLRRYFKRLWLVQEVSLPRRDRVSFQWGSCNYRGNPLEVLQERWEIRHDMVVKDLDWSISPINPSSGMSIAGWVHYGTRKECYNPRDKVYALLSLLNSTDSHKSVRVDYVRTAEEVYEDFARYLVGTRDIVTIMWNVTPNLDWSQPSWVPDLRRGFGVPRDETKKDALLYARPSLTCGGRVLSCHLCYLGNVSEIVLEANKVAVYWKAADREDGMFGTLSSPDLSSVDDEERIGAMEFHGPFSRFAGNVVCTLPCAGNPRWTILLRRSGLSASLGYLFTCGGWGSDIAYLDPNKRPQERRLYHLA